MNIMFQIGVYVVLVLIGFLVGYLTKSKPKVDGLIKVDESSEKIFIDFLWLTPVGDIPKKKYLNVEVVKK